MKTDVSIIMNLHREGGIATSSFESVIKNIYVAKIHNIRCEFIVVVDRGDDKTLRICKQYSDIARTIQCDFGDLSQSRNFGIGAAEGIYSAFIDGDDLWGHDWIYRAYELSKKISDQKMIIHPQNNLFFGRGITPYFWVHPDMRYDAVSYDDILSSNRWTALSFAKTEIYRKFPYHENLLHSGFGYEDWLWHIETAHQGYLHITAGKTIHFIRRKTSGSLLQESNKNHVLPNVRKLKNFNTLKMAST